MDIKVCYSGYIDASSGMGEASRNFIAALYSAQVDLTTEIIPNIAGKTDLGNSYNIAKSLQGRSNDYRFKIIHTTPDLVTKYLDPMRYHIFHLFWETDRLPKWWVWCINLVDEVWTGDEHQAEVFRKSGVKKHIWVCPQPIDTSITNLPPFHVLDHKGFMFYSVFQWIERKNAKVLLEAYWREFQGEDNVSLIIKTYKEKYGAEELLSIKRDIETWKRDLKLSRYPRVGIYVPPMDRYDILRFHTTGDCFVSAHRGEGWCQKPGTKIITMSGVEKIEDCDGKSVLTDKGRFQKSKLLSRSYCGEVIKITPYFSSPVAMTLKHKVLAIKRKHGGKLYFSKKKKGEWIMADELKKGDIVCFPRLNTQSDKENILISDHVSDLLVRGGKVKPAGSNQTGIKIDNPLYHELKNGIPVDEDFMYLCGLFLAEGSTNGGREIVFSINQMEVEIRDEIYRISWKLFGIKPSGNKLDRNRLDIRIHSTVLGRFFRKLFGTNASDKRLPEWVLGLSPDKLKSLIKGMWRGDGSIYSESGVAVGSYSTVSENLAWQLYLILTKFVSDPISIRRKKRTGGKDEYVLKIKGANNIKDLDFLFPAPQPTRVNRKNGWGDDNYLYLTIRKVEKEDYKGTVYNLSVSGDETYVTEGFVVHNCIPIAESMLMGKPVISTAYGGINEVVPDDTIYKVGYKMEPIHGMSWAPWYEADQMWAEPNIDELRKHMRYVFEHQAEAKERGLKNQKYVLDNFSYLAIGNKMKDRLTEIEKAGLLL